MLDLTTAKKGCLIEVLTGNDSLHERHKRYYASEVDVEVRTRFGKIIKKGDKFLLLNDIKFIKNHYYMEILLDNNVVYIKFRNINLSMFKCL